ncbi:PaaI family thioesterase [Brevundimonas sp.]|uniref:PaaI family thioesterase n=1 Tax=Brevundimonas sp. TaxID=1871086 RepID=UPI00286B78A3|nr:PaaI family thioesterase [Brevundimonas sp.]
MTPLLDTIPYARFLGLRTEMDGDVLTVVMPFADHLVGNPMLPALHGGSTAAMLELTAIAQVAHTWPGLRLPRPITVTTAYLRSGKPMDVHARARISRAGRRVAHVLAEAWQEDPSQPIASLTAHFSMDEHNC